jgi:hypothetical protein
MHEKVSLTRGEDCMGTTSNSRPPGVELLQSERSVTGVAAAAAAAESLPRSRIGVAGSCGCARHVRGGCAARRAHSPGGHSWLQKLASWPDTNRKAAATRRLLLPHARTWVES